MTYQQDATIISRRFSDLFTYEYDVLYVQCRYSLSVEGDDVDRVDSLHSILLYSVTFEGVLLLLSFSGRVEVLHSNPALARGEHISWG